VRSVPEDSARSAEAVEHRGGVSSIQVSPGQFEKLRGEASAYILQFLDYVDLTDGRSYSVCQNDFTREVYFVEVDDAV